MPQNIIMNGMLTHTLVATMVATVLIFPTPSDLWSAVSRDHGQSRQTIIAYGGIDRQPLDVSYTSTDSEIKAALDRCIVRQNSQKDFNGINCVEVLDVAEQVFKSTPDSERDHAIFERLRLLQTIQCRFLWVEDRRLSLTEKIKCQEALPILAEAS